MFNKSKEKFKIVFCCLVLLSDNFGAMDNLINFLLTVS